MISISLTTSSEGFAGMLSICTFGRSGSARRCTHRRLPAVCCPQRTGQPDQDAPHIEGGWLGDVALFRCVEELLGGIRCTRFCKLLRKCYRTRHRPSIQRNYADGTQHPASPPSQSLAHIRVSPLAVVALSLYSIE